MAEYAVPRCARQISLCDHGQRYGAGRRDAHRLEPGLDVRRWPAGLCVQLQSAGPRRYPGRWRGLDPGRISIPLAPLEAAGCALPNTAAIIVPAAGAADNYDGTDDSSMASADAFLTWVDGFGVTHVTCDPSNLKTTKTSKGDCVPAGGGFRCEFVVTVENMGPDPYHGPIKLGEQLSLNPQSVTFSASRGCFGGGSSYQCFNWHVDLDKKQSVDLTVTVTVPAGKQCALTNKAVTIFPAAGTRFNNKTGDDVDAATAKYSISEVRAA